MVEVKGKGKITLHNEGKKAQQEQNIVFVPFWPVLNQRRQINCSTQLSNPDA